MASVIDGGLGVADLFTDFFLRRLHKKLYGEIWVWAGKYRGRELNIGVAPELIAVQVRQALGSALWRFENAGWEARLLGVAVHAELVHIHPFADGNGRTTRLLASLIYLAAQTGADLRVYDWDLDKTTYIGLLRECDQHHDPSDLAEFVQTHPLN